MKKKRILLLLAALYLCIFSLSILSKNFFSLTGSTAVSSAESAWKETVSTEADTLDSASVISVETDTEATDVDSTEMSTAIINDTETADTEILDTEVVDTEITDTEVMDTEVMDTQTDSAASYPFTFNSSKRLNIHKEASIDSEVIGKVLPGTGGMILDTSNEEWAKIEYEGVTGYCKSAYISHELPEANN